MTEYLLNGEPQHVEVQRYGSEFQFAGHTIHILEHGKCRVQLQSGRTVYGYCTKIADLWWVHIDGKTLKFQKMEHGARSDGSSGDCVSPMPGKILEIFVQAGEHVEKGQPLLVLEAMKMEHRILAPQEGEIAAIHATVGQQVEQGKNLVDIV